MITFCVDSAPQTSLPVFASRDHPEPRPVELDVVDRLDKRKASGALQIEDRSEAAKRIREELFGKYSKSNSAQRRL